MHRTHQIFLAALIVCVALALTVTTATTARGQDAACAPRDDVLDRLAERFGEARQSIGLASGNQVVEMFASPETGTWTLTLTRPDGMTCIIGVGEGFEQVEAGARPTGQPV